MGNKRCYVGKGEGIRIKMRATRQTVSKPTNPEVAVCRTKEARNKYHPVIQRNKNRTVRA